MNLCVDWASVVDTVEHTYSVQRAALAVLFGMINSPHWHPHFVIKKWELLQYFTSVPDDSLPLRRCIDNLNLVGMIKNLENPAVIILWLMILWHKQKTLTPQIQEQLEWGIQEVIQGNRREDHNRCLAMMDSELEKAESTLALTQHGAQSTNTGIIALRMKIGSFRKARVLLVALGRD